MSPKNRLKILATAIALMGNINARAESAPNTKWDIYTLATENELSVLNGLLDRGLLTVNPDGRLELSQGLFIELEGAGILENTLIDKDTDCDPIRTRGPKPKN